MTSITSTTASTTLPVTITSTTTDSSTASTASSIASTTTTASTTFSPVETARRNLCKSAVALRWEENVGNVEGISKIFGAIKVFFLESWFGGLWEGQAEQSDRLNGATIELFNEKAAALVNAVAIRNLTATEAATLGENPVNYIHGRTQATNAARNVEARDAEKAFYDVFKTRCTQLGVSDADYGIYSNAAMSHIQKVATAREDLETDAPKSLMPTKLATVEESFGKRIYTDMVAAFANLSIENITIDGFKEKVATIKAFFGANSLVDIEASLRQALKAKFNSNEFQTLGAEFLNANPANARVAALKTELKAKFEAEKTEIETVLSELRGTTGWNGTINAASGRVTAAQRDLDAARLAFVTAYTATFGAITITSAIETLVGLDLSSFPAELQTAKTELVAKLAEHKAAKEEFDALVAKLAELATYDNTGAVNGGKLHVVNGNLLDTGLTAKARAEATKIGRFYKELNQDVTDASKQVRYNAIHHVNILGA